MWVYITTPPPDSQSPATPNPPPQQLLYWIHLPPYLKAKTPYDIDLTNTGRCKSCFDLLSSAGSRRFFAKPLNSVFVFLTKWIAISDSNINASRSASTVHSPRFVNLIVYLVNSPILIRAIWPGKTGPRLWADLLHYLPQSKGLNGLSDPPPEFKQNLPPPPPHKHTHRLSQLTDKCSLPETNLLEIDKKYNVSAICDGCRLYFDIEVEFTKSKHYTKLHICPTEDPLHHFRFESSVSKPVDVAYIRSHPESRWVDKRVFSCSGPTCPTLLTITTRAPILNQYLTELLVDERQLEARMAKAQIICRDTIEKDVEFVPTSPYKALGTLCAYVKNARKGDQRSIPSENLKFLSSLGGDCDVLMKLAGFTYEEEVRNLCTLG